MAKLYQLVTDDANYDQVKRLLDEGQSPDSAHPSGTPVLNLAAREGAVKIMELLLERGANQRITGPVTGYTALHEAISGPSNEVKKIDPENNTHRLEAVKKLLAQPGAYPKSDSVDMDLVQGLWMISKNWQMMENGLGMDMAVELLKAGGRADVENRNELSARQFIIKANAHNWRDMNDKQRHYLRATTRILMSDNPGEWEKTAAEAHGNTKALTASHKGEQLSFLR